MKRNALHRTAEEMQERLDEYGLKIDFELRIMRTAFCGTFCFPTGATSELCKSVMIAGMRAIDAFEAHKHHVAAADMQDAFL